MDSKKQLEQFIKPASWQTIVTWVLLAVTVVSLAVGVVFATSKNNPANAVQFDPYPSGTEEGSYAYIDVILVSDWIYNIDYGQQVYYSVMDADGQWYVVRLTKQQFEEMSTQYAFYALNDENVVALGTYRLYGLVQTPDSDVSDAIASYWDLSQIEYSQYFGNTYLNATSSPSSERGSVMFIVAMISFLIWVVFFAVTIGPTNAAKKNIKRLADLEEIDNAAYELTSPTNESFNREKVRFSRNYIFGKGTGAAIKYSDILWCYKQTVNNRGVVTSSLIAQTAAAKKQTLFWVNGYDNDGLIQRAIEIISECNPEVRVGYTSGNVQASKNRV